MIENLRPIYFTLLLCGILFRPAVALADMEGMAPVIKLATDSISEDGHIKIEWVMTRADATVEVEQANSINFVNPKTIYEGPDNATFISGLENGIYYYRVRRLGGEWSDTVKVSVQHHSLALAFTLFGLGALVFFLTVFIVIRGAIQASSD
jgi:hypothetical protein